MTQAKHTAGPWKVTRDPKFNHLVIETKDKYISTGIFASDGDHEKVKFIAKEEQSANARLIEMAPEMLEALEIAILNMPQSYAQRIVASAIEKAKGLKPRDADLYPGSPYHHSVDS